MSRRSRMWDRKFKQAGGLDRIIPTSIVSNVDRKRIWDGSKHTSSRGSHLIVTRPMSQEKLERIMTRLER